MYVIVILFELFGDRELYVIDIKFIGFVIGIVFVLVILLLDFINFCVVGIDLELFIWIEL